MKPPAVSPAILSQVLATQFSFKKVAEDSVKELDGFCDRNYYFKGQLLCEAGQQKSCTHQSATKSVCLKEDEFVVKLMNTKDSNHPTVVDAMVASMEHVLSKGLRVPFTVNARDGSRFAQVDHCTLLGGMANGHIAETSAEDVTCCIIVMTYLRGTALEKVPKTQDILFQFGALAGRLDAAWKTFHHPGVLQKWELDDWNLLKLPLQKCFLVDKFVEDPTLLDLLKQGMEVYERHVKDRIPDLKRGIIHSDVHDMNVLCNEVGDETNSYQLGIVDFGDIADSPYIFELATVAIDAMYCSDAPLASLKVVVDGYTAHNPLPKEDQDLLLHVVVGKITQWCLLSMVAIKDEPENREYIMRSFDDNVKLLGFLLQYLSMN